jgi:hypothetical protein
MLQVHLQNLHPAGVQVASTSLKVASSGLHNSQVELPTGTSPSATDAKLYGHCCCKANIVQTGIPAPEQSAGHDAASSPFVASHLHMSIVCNMLFIAW